MLAGLDGGDATKSVVALAAGALNPPAGAAFLHRRDLAGHEDGHGHRAQLLTSHLRAHLLLLPPAPFQLVGSQGQGHSPKGCGKKNLPQARCQPQLGERGLEERDKWSGYVVQREALGVATVFLC